MTRVLVTGAGGQVGAAVARLLAGRAEVIAHGRATLDLANPAQIEARVREASPRVVVNAAAYTAVDRAESDAQTAQAVNAAAPGVIARACRAAGALLVHFSTDYVFDGTKGMPYVEDDATNPLGVYGLTKLEGERAVAASGCPHLILRTAWVYGPAGKNFMLTMLRLAAQGAPIRVVDDQRGAPTSSLQIARSVVALLTAGESHVSDEAIGRLENRSGLYHATAAGETTWHGFATEIFAERARQPGGAFKVPTVEPIPTRDYPTPAKRPAYSVLSSAKLEQAFGVRLGDWRAGLAEAISVLGRG
ncbi:MAG TPA: dTDP-4-dehydrorhamnose reductase [Usitatibacter sp.]|nr:dTDP-4-dehydrorhamnose reductase [Usitatibacter sp.]